jgi:hypothetical protein
MKDKKFKVHMMYKDCKEVKAGTMEEHLKLKKKGYSHKKSKDCETKDGASFTPELRAEAKDPKSTMNESFKKVVMGASIKPIVSPTPKPKIKTKPVKAK